MAEYTLTFIDQRPELTFVEEPLGLNVTEQTNELNLVEETLELNLVQDLNTFTIATEGIQGPSGKDAANVLVSLTPPSNPTLNDVWVKPNV